MKIKVEQKHIDKGSSKGCPIALAINEQYKPRSAVQVYVNRFIPERAVIQFDQHHFISKKAREFIDRFDKAQPVKPFVLCLREGVLGYALRRMKAILKD